ncbi:unnamed protein product [Caenorhabditis angaria]|uniref:Reverse transcriptase domain-containing protein n=1 Tax=Caenorhabditis angaria TaxID=860376 RepID=A0A9P1IEE8_9PELO|nr:unnamed protein product [Caenorhabditis angaria]
MVFLTETFLYDSISNSLLNLPGYALYRQDRLETHPKKRGGGVMALIKNSIVSSETSFEFSTAYTSHFSEFLIIDCPKMLTRIFLVYRPPQSLHHCTNNLFSLLSSNMHQKWHNIIVGDLNLPNVDWSTLMSKSPYIELQAFYVDHGLCQLINFPTRISSSGTSNILDIILSSSPEKLINIKPSQDFVQSDHISISFEVAANVRPLDCASSNKLDFRKCDFVKLNDYIASTNWEDQFSYLSNIQEKYDHFIRTINEYIQDCCPIGKKFRTRNISRRLKRIRSRIRFISNRNDNSQNLPRIFKLQKKLLAMARRKNRRYDNEVARCGNNKRIQRVISQRLKYRPNLQSILLDGRLLTSDDDMANTFVSVFEKYMKRTGEISGPCQNNRFKSKSVEFPPFVICSILDKLPPKVGFSKDFINFFVLKKISVSIALPLSIIFTEIYNECTFPEDWKTSVVIPIHKRGRTNDPENYRPVALTSPISRVLEKVIANYIRNTFHNSFDVNQHGFISKRSCITALLSTITKWKFILDRGKSVDVIYIDFKRAFDNVPHTHLLHKLRNFGFPEDLINFFTSFLFNRTSQVKVNNHISSNQFQVTSGVLQGTVTGPLLFLIYINDVLLEVDDEVEATIFADDIKISSSNPEKLQSTLDKIVAWSKKWDMPMAPSKTSVLHLGKNNKKNPYFINGIQIPSVSVVRDLGIYIDEKLNFEYHCNETVRKTLTKCREIQRSFSFKDIRPYILIFKTYVAPIIDYGCCVYRPFISKKLEVLLERPLRRFTMNIFRRCNFQYSSYDNRLEQADYTTSARRSLEHSLSIMFSISKNLIHFPDKIRYFSSSSSPRTPLAIKLNDKRFCKTFFSYIFKHWNSLATLLTNDTSLTMLKSTIRALPNSFFVSPRP